MEHLFALYFVGFFISYLLLFSKVTSQYITGHNFVDLTIVYIGVITLSLLWPLLAVTFILFRIAMWRKDE